MDDAGEAAVAYMGKDRHQLGTRPGLSTAIKPTPRVIHWPGETTRESERELTRGNATFPHFHRPTANSSIN